MLIRFVLFLISTTMASDLLHQLNQRSPISNEAPPLIRPLVYDLQIQLPLSESTSPDTPLFTAHVVVQFELSSDIGLTTPFLSDNNEKGAKIKFVIDGLDHFENVSLVFNGSEIGISNVLITDLDMEIIVAQPILYAGRYTLSVNRYKGTIGSAIYYRDAGEHAVFGSNLFRAGAVFPTLHPLTQKVVMSVSIVHPLGTTALSSAPSEGTTTIDEHWQMTSFRPSSPMVPSLLSLVLLPVEYKKMENTYNGINLAVHYNEHRIEKEAAKHLLNTATQVLGLLKQFFSSSMAMSKLDLVILNDVSLSSSFGTIVIPESTYTSYDFANQIWLLAKLIARHWVGGLVAVSREREFCLQEDILSYIAYKVVKRMTNDDNIRLAHYMKISLTESVLEPGMALMLKEPIDEKQISAYCGLKGVVEIESMEHLLNEERMMTAINKMVFHSKTGTIDMQSFMDTFSETLADGVNAAQVFGFWRTHGGIPSLEVARQNESLRLKQRIESITVDNGSDTWARMELWPLVMQFTEFKLPIQLMLSQGVHLAPVREGLSMANLGFNHFYRVNYDLSTWKMVLEVLRQNATNYTPRERMQLTNDFCHFYSIGALEEPVATALRNKWMAMIESQSHLFPLCEAATFRCVAGRKGRPLSELRTQFHRKRLFESMTSSAQMTCGRGAAHVAVNELCLDLYGTKCF